MAVIVQFDLGSEGDMALIRRFLAETADVTPVQMPVPPAIFPPPLQIQVAAVDPVYMQAASPTPAPAAAAEDEEVDVTGVVDADGLPWDPRIHSSSKQLVADGTWRKRRNTAKELFAEVEAELRGLSAVDASVDAPIPAPPPPPPPPPAAVAFANPAPPPPAAADNQLDLFIRGVTVKMVDRSLDAAELHRVLAHYNVENGLLGLKDHASLIPMLAVQFGVTI